MISDLAIRAAEIAADSKASLLYVSSSETYGKSGLQLESDNLLIPVSFGARMEYMLGKLSAEHMIHNMSIRHGFRMTTVRPFNIIGEHQSSRIGFVVPTFIENALKNKPLPVFYGGLQTRCFCYVEDMVDGLIAVQENGKNRETYNLGNPYNETSILNLGQKIKNICNSSSAIESVIPENIYGKTFIEASSKKPSIEKINLHTGWKPETDLDSALLKIATCYKNELSN